MTRTRSPEFLSRIRESGLAYLHEVVEAHHALGELEGEKMWRAVEAAARVILAGHDAPPGEISAEESAKLFGAIAVARFPDLRFRTCKAEDQKEAAAAALRSTSSAHGHAGRLCHRPATRLSGSAPLCALAASARGPVRCGPGRHLSAGIPSSLLTNYLQATVRAVSASILLVEDDPDVREITESVLGDAGYRVHSGPTAAVRPAADLEAQGGIEPMYEEPR
jgi:hypothetical protein